MLKVENQIIGSSPLKGKAGLVVHLHVALEQHIGRVPESTSFKSDCISLVLIGLITGRLRLSRAKLRTILHREQ